MNISHAHISNISEYMDVYFIPMNSVMLIHISMMVHVSYFLFSDALVSCQKIYKAAKNSMEEEPEEAESIADSYMTHILGLDVINRLKNMLPRLDKMSRKGDYFKKESNKTIRVINAVAQ